MTAAEAAAQLRGGLPGRSVSPGSTTPTAMPGTAADYAAQVARLSAAGQAAYNAGGAYLNGQIVAAGTPGGQTLDSLTPGKNANTQDAGNLFSGNEGLVQLSDTAKTLKAGYYQIPGQPGAQFFDPSPASGTVQASQAFITWANSLQPGDMNPDTGEPEGYIPLEGGPEAAFQSQYGQTAAGIATTNAIIAGGKDASGSYEDSQNRVLGIGPYQQFMLGANGEQVRVSDALKAAAGPAPAATYKDVSTYQSTTPAGGTGVGSSMGYWQTVAGGSFWHSTATAADLAAKEADAQAAADALNQHNSDAYAGLQQERIIAAAVAAGQNPGDALKAAMNAAPGSAEAASAQAIANSGISAAQEKQIYDTYNRISDPAEQAAYLAAQDPGNLTLGLRAKQNATPQKAVEKNWMLKNAMAPTVEWSSAAKYGDTTGGGIKTTYGDITQTDTITGRSIFYGNVPVLQEYVAAQGRGSFDNAMQRLGGAMYGAFMGFVGSFGNPVGAVLGAAGGSGLLGGINLKKPGKTTWGATQQPGDISGVALSFGEAMLFAGIGGPTMGAAGRIAVGAGMGTVNGFISGGTKGAEFGGVMGGVGGWLGGKGGNGPTWAQKAQNAWMGVGA